VDDELFASEFITSELPPSFVASVVPVDFVTGPDVPDTPDDPDVTPDDPLDPDAIPDDPLDPDDIPDDPLDPDTSDVPAVVFTYAGFLA
jgi:hypothetical protein